MGYGSCMKLLDQLREAIEASSKSRYRLWKETGIFQSVLSRLMAGKRGISLDGLELLADALDMEIVLRPKQPTSQQTVKG
jgi:transcriptional regulator with XRE-family HTH domain